MADPKFKSDIHRRIEIVIDALRDGCNDCPDRGMLCTRHTEIASDLFLDPRKYLPIYEREIFGDDDGHEII